MYRQLSRPISGVLLILLAFGTWQSARAQVRLEQQDGRFRRRRDGKPYPIRGVGGDSRLKGLAAAGGNSIRTWDSQNLGKILDAAHRNGLTVCAGLWLGHQRHGFNYQDQGAVLQQLEEIPA